jgi:DNA mismatch repair protein MutS2
MDQHSLEKLEFERVRDLLAGCARTALGRDLAQRISPSAEPARVRRWLEQLQQMERLMAVRDVPPLGGLSDVRPLIRRAVPPTSLEPEEFAILAEALRTVAGLRRYFSDLPAGHERVGEIAERIGDFSAIANRIDAVIDRRGRVRDDATERLSRIRRLMDEGREEIRRVFDRLLRQASVVKWLQYPAATFHGDRMVLPVKTEYRGRVSGIVHRSSETGQTVFVEPTPAVVLNNTLVDLSREESDEIRRILWELTHTVHLNRDALVRTFDAVAVVDLQVAKILMARRYGMSVPQVSEDHRLRLTAARHPLLLAKSNHDASPVVPIDVRLGEDFDLLVVTGPNTGGKTVALKTVGLIAMMTQAGLPIPAGEGCCLPVFDDVLVDIGDEQSLQQSLSTFSGHLRRILEILRRGTRKTLVLLDELGAGTDPDDGAALGRAIVERLLDIGALTMVTTHIGALKALAYEHPCVDNAAVQFDLVTLQPTYVLHIGEPGNSNALIVAARLGMPTDLVSAAQRYLGERDRALSRAIAGTIESRRAAEEARRQAEQAQRMADQQRAEAGAAQQRLADEQARFQRWVQRITSLHPGATVRVRRFDRPGRVVQMNLHKQRVTVAVGGLEIEVPLTDVIVDDDPRVEASGSA